jgi:hypothetical protein
LHPAPGENGLTGRPPALGAGHRGGSNPSSRTGQGPISDRSAASSAAVSYAAGRWCKSIRSDPVALRPYPGSSGRPQAECSSAGKSRRFTPFVPVVRIHPLRRAPSRWGRTLTSEYGIYGGCSATGQSACLWSRMLRVRIPSATRMTLSSVCYCSLKGCGRMVITSSTTRGRAFSDGTARPVVHSMSGTPVLYAAALPPPRRSRRKGGDGSIPIHAVVVCTPCPGTCTRRLTAAALGL